MNLANASSPAHTGGFCFEPRASIGAGGVVNFDRRVRNQGGEQMAVLGTAFGMLAAIWILVLLGSPFFGPRDH
jgi:hypothetical protein